MKREVEFRKAKMCEIRSIKAAPALGDLWRKAMALWQPILGLGRRPARRLRLCESLSLGDRRFVAVVEFEQARFLVGGTSASLALLARLGNSGDGAVRRSEGNEIPELGACAHGISEEGR